MANVEAKHETVFDAGAGRSRLARVYAEALLAAARKESEVRVDEVGAELAGFARGATASPAVATFLANPTVAKKAKAAALADALRAGGSDLFRGLIGVLVHNNRLGLLPGIAAAYRQLLDKRAGRVGVTVTAAVALSAAERDALVATLRGTLRREPVVSVRVDPELLGGMVVQVGDSVIDTSVRTRLQALRTALLEQ
jgi:F-type H+-transporting ATPase subunit delta